MAFTYLSLIIIIPAVLVLFAGGVMTIHEKPVEPSRRWIIVLLSAAILILIPINLAIEEITTNRIGLFLILLIPTLVGLLALILIQRRAIYAQWWEDKRLISALLVALLLLIVLTIRVEIYYPLVLIVPAAFLALIWSLLLRFELGILFGLSSLVLIGQILEAVGLIGGRRMFAAIEFEWVLIPLIFSWYILSLILPAVLIYRGLTTKDSNNSRLASICFILAGLLILVELATTARHGVMVNATGHAAEDHLPFGEMLIAVLTGMVLLVALAGKRRLIGLAFIVLIPIMIASAYAAGWLVDPQAVTVARADRITAAVKAYHLQTGEYPSELDDLTPDYMPFILGPLTGRAQVWCYQGEREFYRLGYVFIQRYYGPTFPDPYSEILIHAFAGDIPEGGWMCDQELEQAKQTRGL
jgi:hypothetical protein